MGVEPVAEGVAHQVDRERSDEDGGAGESGDPPGVEHVDAALAEHVAPHGGGRLPRAAVGGGTPRPRNDRNDSRMITLATWSVAITTITEMRFGRIWRKMIRTWLIPRARPAV